MFLLIQGGLMKKVLVVIDMQNDFIRGSLGSEQAIKIIPSVVKKIEEYKENNYEIVCTMDTHDEKYLETQEGKNLPVIHCKKNTGGWELDREVLDSLPDNYKIFEKNNFLSIELAEYLKKVNDNENLIEIEIVGLVTSICVISNALMIKGFLPEVEISVSLNGTASIGKEDYEAALLVMKMCQITLK